MTLNSIKTALYKALGGASWRTTVTGAIGMASAYVMLDPSVLDMVPFLPREWQQPIQQAARLVTLISGGAFVRLVKDKNVTGGTVPATIEAITRVIPPETNPAPMEVQLNPPSKGVGVLALAIAGLIAGMLFAVGGCAPSAPTGTRVSLRLFPGPVIYGEDIRTQFRATLPRLRNDSEFLEQEEQDYRERGPLPWRRTYLVFATGAIRMPLGCCSSSTGRPLSSWRGGRL